MPSDAFENWDFLSYILLGSNYINIIDCYLEKDFEIVYLKVSKLHRQIDFQAPVFFPKLKRQNTKNSQLFLQYPELLSVEIVSLIFFYFSRSKSGMA